MKSIRGSRLPAATVIPVLAALLVGTNTFAQQGAYIEEIVEIEATVTAVDSEQRLVTLRGEDGRELTVQAGEEVVNFSQIEAGDILDVMFYEAFAAEVTHPPEGVSDTDAVVVASREAPIGDKPGAAVGVVYTAVVTIDEIDGDTVKFTGPEGQPREVTVQRPEVQAFVAELNPGDRVLLTFGEAVAIEMQPSDN